LSQQVTHARKEKHLKTNSGTKKEASREGFDFFFCGKMWVELMIYT
jgi:hypothetical protein